ncbi:MAG: GatB/YqeY domain-containing protein [Coxiellaceae bacterium]|nr:MAG: GatB/YqeY domain-containing protein [Coxiellaceae bacterium]
MSNLKARITEDMKEAMRAKDQTKLGAIRLLLAAIKQREVDERIALDDTQVMAVIDKMIKQRRESVAQYQNANRQDLVDQENFEITVLQNYLPTPLTEAEIQQLVAAAVKESGATSIKDMGKVMAILKPQMQGRADMGAVSTKIKAALGG